MCLVIAKWSTIKPNNKNIDVLSQTPCSGNGWMNKIFNVYKLNISVRCKIVQNHYNVHHLMTWRLDEPYGKKFFI